MCDGHDEEDEDDNNQEEENQRTKNKEEREREREREVYCLIQFCKNLIIQKNSDLRTTT